MNMHVNGTSASRQPIQIPQAEARPLIQLNDTESALGVTGAYAITFKRVTIVVLETDDELTCAGTNAMPSHVREWDPARGIERARDQAAKQITRVRDFKAERRGQHSSITREAR